MKLRSKRTYILPTRYGVIFGIIILIEFIVSITFGHPFAYLITFISSSLIFMSSIYTNSSFENISVLPIKEDLLEASSDIRVRVPLQLGDKFESKNLVGCEDDLRFSSAQDVSMNSSFVDISLGKKGRGIHQINRVKLSTTFPFGLFRAWRYYDIDRTIYIYPKLSNLQTQRDSTVLGQETSESNDKVGNNNEDFLEHRKALETDSWRHIDWKAYARGRGLLSKVYAANSDYTHRVEIRRGCSEDEIANAASLLFKYFNESKGIQFFVDDQLLFSGNDREVLKQSIKFLCLVNWSQA